MTEPSTPLAWREDADFIADQEAEIKQTLQLWISALVRKKRLIDSKDNKLPALANSKEKPHED